ncbi:MAG: hypothetical protein FD122_2834 [Stygiobacter sp.]|nr:MAG: hypothetical protein FD122_2834 [Stygiobacter sp.]KAF0213221.1 MAG: hypothetical protein FD178_2934 [Ignavibacteria bacterium]
MVVCVLCGLLLLWCPFKRNNIIANKKGKEMDIISTVVTYLLSTLFGYYIYSKTLKIIPIQKLIPLLSLPIVLAYLGKHIRIISIDNFKVWFDHFMVGLAIGLFVGFLFRKFRERKSVSNTVNG